MSTSKSHALTRRRFIATSSSSVVALVGATDVWGLNRTGKPALPVDVALFDERYSDSRRFAHALAEAGAEAVSIQGDIAKVWYGRLRERFAHARTMRIAGMTPHSDLVLIQGLAAEQGGRLMFQACHDCRGADVLSHRLFVQSGALTTLRLTDEQWPASMARLASLDGLGRADSATSLCATTARSSDHPGTLWSWRVS